MFSDQCAAKRAGPSATQVVESGHNVARMRYKIIVAPDAAEAYKKLPAPIRSQVRDALEVHLRYEPTKVSKSRIKRLRGLSRPQYRLRIDEIRVFYDVKETTVEILAIVSKREAQKWLDKEGTPDPESRVGKG